MPGLTLPDWFTPDNLRTISLVVAVGALVLAVLVLRFVQKLMMRLVFTLVLVAIGGLAWVERADLADCAKTCECRILGFDVKIPTDDLPDNAPGVCADRVR